MIMNEELLDSFESNILRRFHHRVACIADNIYMFVWTFCPTLLGAGQWIQIGRVRYHFQGGSNSSFIHFIFIHSNENNLYYMRVYVLYVYLCVSGCISVRVSRCGHRGTGIWMRAPGCGHLGAGTWVRALGCGHLGAGTWVRAPGCGYLGASISVRASCPDWYTGDLSCYWHSTIPRRH